MSNVLSNGAVESVRVIEDTVGLPFKTVQNGDFPLNATMSREVQKKLADRLEYLLSKKEEIRESIKKKESHPLLKEWIELMQARRNYQNSIASVTENVSSPILNQKDEMKENNYVHRATGVALKNLRGEVRGETVCVMGPGSGKKRE